VCRHRKPEYLDRAAIGGDQSGEHPDGRGLSCAIRTQEAEKRSAGHFEIDAIDCGFGPVELPEIAHQYGRGRHLFSVTSDACPDVSC